jgi:predicted MFS family arabinose efflux permease
MTHILATRARNALWALFFLMGIVSMAWIPRIPEIKEANGLSDGAFGLVLISSSLGAVFGAQLAGRLVFRFGSRPVMYWLASGVSMGVAVMGLSTNPFVLAIGLFIMGFSYGGLDVGANAQAVAIENHLSKRYMISFHGMWSVGTLAATVLGAAISFLVTPMQNLLALSTLGIVAMLWVNSKLLPTDLDNHHGQDQEAETGEKAGKSVPWFAIAVIPLWFMGIGASASMIAEGAAADWGALLLRDHMAISQGLNSTAFAAFGIAMLISRFLGDRWLERFGAYAVIRYLGVLGGAIWGLSIVLAVWISGSSSLAALVIVSIGFFAAGIAIGPMFPAFILGSSKIRGVAPSVGIARVGVISIGAYFVGPSVVGLLSELITLPYAMLYPAGALILAGYLAKGLKQ